MFGIMDKTRKFTDNMWRRLSAGEPNYMGLMHNPQSNCLEVFLEHYRYNIIRFCAKITDAKGRLYILDEHSKNIGCILRSGPAEKPQKNGFVLFDGEGNYLCSSKDDSCSAMIYICAIPITGKSGELVRPIAAWGRFFKQPGGAVDVKNNVVAITATYNTVFLMDSFADDFDWGSKGGDDSE